MLSTRHRAPATGHLARGTGHRAPDTRHQAPGTGHRAPGTRHQAPGTGHRAPRQEKNYKSERFAWEVSQKRLTGHRGSTFQGPGTRIRISIQGQNPISSAVWGKITKVSVLHGRCRKNGSPGTAGPLFKVQNQGSVLVFKARTP